MASALCGSGLNARQCGHWSAKRSLQHQRCLRVAAVDTLLKKPKLSYVGLSTAAILEGVCTNKQDLIGSIAATTLMPPQISRSDADFLAMGLEFVETQEGLKITELNELFEKVHCTQLLLLVSPVIGHNGSSCSCVNSVLSSAAGILSQKQHLTTVLAALGQVNDI
eukprot:GHRR01034505.1.p1 GENE.GHRR01034505.1~~GHRR01034505.1.p1  ORF type:complete len:166 (+),score=38.29 GHRR01034505.1:128-625(+)